MGEAFEFYRVGFRNGNVKKEGIPPEEFLNLYNGIYHYKNRADWQVEPEREIENLLLKYAAAGFGSLSLNKSDACNILCWKMGRKPENEYVIRLAEKVVEICEKLNIKGKPDEKTARNLVEKLAGISGIGIVYAITFLFVMSGGDYPIYDQYANRAVWDILSKDNPLGNKVISDLPLTSAWNKYKEFCTGFEELFNRIFGDIPSDDINSIIDKKRRLDRALWAYGHILPISK